MIKVIAFDMVGVLVGEKNIKLTETEDKIERLFGDNINDEEFVKQAITKTNLTSKEVLQIANDVINKLYYLKDEDIFLKIKKLKHNFKTIIATNHISLIKQFINNSFNKKFVDDMIISAEIGLIKPYNNFYMYILNKFNIQPGELLFLDDNIKNIESAKKLGINTIYVTKEKDIYNEIKKVVG